MNSKITKSKLKRKSSEKSLVEKFRRKLEKVTKKNQKHQQEQDEKVSENKEKVSESLELDQEQVESETDESETEETEQVSLENSGLFNLKFNCCEIPADFEFAKNINDWNHVALQDDTLKRIVVSCPKSSPVKNLPVYHSDMKYSLNHDMNQLQVKQKLITGFAKLNAKICKKAHSTTFSPLQAAMFPIINNYQDFFYCNETQPKMKDIQHLIALHSLNHIYKTRDLIMKNNQALKKASIMQEDEDTEKLDEEKEHRDQGFTRPKVLVLLPFKNDAYMLINNLIAVSGCTQLDNKKRFQEEFGPGDNLHPNPRKPQDYNTTFAGNIDDCFKIGIRFSKKQAKLYAPFYSSDIIIASPLGLSMIIGNPGDKKRDFDYLSSIEIAVLGHADTFLMQNWDHVKLIFEHMNKIPKESHGCDFSRARNYILDGHASHFLQILSFSQFSFPQLNSLISSYSCNISGRVKVTQEYLNGAVSDVIVPYVSQVFYRVPSSSSLVDAPDTRFNFFVSKILPMLRSSSTHSTSLHQQSHTLLVVPSYFDFTRIRNYLNDHNYSACFISEYNSQSKVDRALSDFVKGEIKLMVYSERYHFFRRTKLRGVKHVVFYSPLTYSKFYSELVNMIGNGGSGSGQQDELQDVSCTCLFSLFDRGTLEGIVGSSRMNRMITGSKEAYMFSS